MINFEEELKKFTPSNEVDNIEDILHHQDVTDAVEILIQMLKDSKED